MSKVYCMDCDKKLKKKRIDYVYENELFPTCNKCYQERKILILQSEIEFYKNEINIKDEKIKKLKSTKK